jgi:hypothetical protein
VISKLIQRITGTDRKIAYSIDGYWHNISYSKETLRYLCDITGIDVIKIESIGNNDPVFGFVQPNTTLLYRLASSFAALLKMDSQLLLIGKLKK